MNANIAMLCIWSQFQGYNLSIFIWKWSEAWWCWWWWWLLLSSSMTSETHKLILPLFFPISLSLSFFPNFQLFNSLQTFSFLSFIFSHSFHIQFSSFYLLSSNVIRILIPLLTTMVHTLSFYHFHPLCKVKLISSGKYFFVSFFFCYRMHCLRVNWKHIEWAIERWRKKWNAYKWLATFFGVVNFWHLECDSNIIFFRVWRYNAGKRLILILNK